MAVLQKEQNTCVGRGFDSAGFMGKLMAWMVKTPGAGGPQWYIVDDQSAAGTPYVVFSNLNNPGANVTGVYMKVGYGGSGQIIVRFYGWWNSSTHLGYGYWGGYILTTVDAGPFIYDFRGGSECMIIQSNVGSSWYCAFFDTWTGLANRVEATSKRGTFLDGNHVGDSSNKIQLMNGISGLVIGTNTDANGWLYFSVADQGSGNYRVNIYKDSARTLLVGHTGNFTASNTNLQSLTITADNTSGLGGSLNYQGPGVLTTSVKHRFGSTFTCNSGHDLTLNGYYFITDYENKATVHFVQVTAKSGDEITFNRTLSVGNFGPNSVISAWEHRYYIAGNNLGSMAASKGKLPYYGVAGSECIPMGFSSDASMDISLNSSSIDPAADLLSLGNGLQREAPSFNNLYGVHRALVYERKSYNAGFSDNGKRMVGVLKNCWVTYNNTMNRSNNGRTILGSDYLYFMTEGDIASNGNGNLAFLFPNTTSLA